MEIAKNIKQHEASILNSPIFKNQTAKAPEKVDFDFKKIYKIFQENNVRRFENEKYFFSNFSFVLFFKKKLLLSMLICPWSVSVQIISLEIWFDAILKNRPSVRRRMSNRLLVKQSFSFFFS